MNDDEMHVLKRNGQLQEVSFDKILHRLKTLGKEADLTHINYSNLCIILIVLFHLSVHCPIIKLTLNFQVVAY